MPQPSLCAIEPTVTRTAALHHAFALRGLLLLVMLAILLQALVSPGVRIATRSHFHLGNVAAQQPDASEGQAHPQADTDADAHSHPHPHPHPHSHSRIATHEHSVERSDVVYVDTQNNEPTSSQTSNRFALDPDLLLLRRDPASVEPSTHLIFAEHTQRYRSRVEPPLERPPRSGS